MNKDANLRKLDLNLQEIFNPDKGFTFLVGAGISIDAPSCLLSAKHIVNKIVESSCPKDEVERILQLDNLRYELIIEGIQRIIDPDLTFMNFFDLFDKPNIIHHFLAKAIQIGEDVITTNFDYLIEIALAEQLQSKEDIILIINKPDYEKFEDIKKLRKQGKFPLCKIHGSKKKFDHWRRHHRLASYHNICARKR